MGFLSMLGPWHGTPCICPACASGSNVPKQPWGPVTTAEGDADVSCPAGFVLFHKSGQTLLGFRQRCPDPLVWMCYFDRIYI
uniref:Uncharacterized protein n=1 Tax=Scleropages formosus TaxID=113540 RepID=A0A8C9SA20_SCLFO